MITLRYKAYSLQNRDIDEVLYFERRRGMRKGFEKLIIGNSINHSEYLLDKIRRDIRSVNNIKFENNRKGSFEIKLWCN